MNDKIVDQEQKVETLVKIKELCKKNGANFTAKQIVSEAAAPQIEFLSAAANMLTAIAGYLYGEKGLNLNTPASQLLGKIKNNSRPTTA